MTVIIGKTRDGPETAETHMRSDGRIKSVRTPGTVVQPIRQSVTTPSLFIVKSVATCYQISKKEIGIKSSAY